MTLSRFRLLKKHSTTMPGIMRFRCFRICLGIVLLLCLLYFIDVINNEPPLTRVVAPKEVPLHPSNVNTNRLQAKKSSISRRLQDFTHDWLRQRRARVDWKNIIKPCADNMAWGLVKDHWGKTNRSSATTSDIIFKDIRPAGEFSKIFIQSKTSDNRTKLIGGDTWRVYLRGPTSLVATVFDHNNGTYEALFLITEPGVYELMIYLDYSLCDGFKDPPLDWFIIGDDQGAHQREGVLGSLDEYLVKQPFETGQPNLTVTVTNAQLKGPLSDKLERLVFCSETCNYLWDGFGQWKNGQWTPYLKESYNSTRPQNYTQSGTLWICGDSLGMRLYRSIKTRPLCKSLYQDCENSYMWTYYAQNKGLNARLEDDLDFRPQNVIGIIVDVLRTPKMQQEESVLLLNLNLHFVGKINFTTYQKLIDDLILVLKAKELAHSERVPKYKAKIIWKSSTAICKEKVSSFNKTNGRFFTTQRVALFNAYSVTAMCKAGFDVVDVYSLTDSYPQRCNDQVHYHDEVFNTMETMLEEYKVHYNKKLDEDEKQDRIKRCISQ